MTATQGLHDAERLISALGRDGDPGWVTVAGGRDLGHSGHQQDLRRTMLNLLSSEAPGQAPAQVDAVIRSPLGEAWHARATADGQQVLLEFEDRSTLRLKPGEIVVLAAQDAGIGPPTGRSFNVPIPGRTMDVGLALLDPITVEEVRSIEAVLLLLEHAIEASALTEMQEQRIRGMVGVLDRQRRDATPDVTARGETVHTTKAVLRAIALEMPVGIVAWDKAGQVLAHAHWYHLADLCHTLARAIS